ncbi:LOW QUALITY PROTEIN: melanoma-associated antigen B5-like [Saccopteryx leptura]|uniref:LOW QUALITY PROTEIN: melanoma-associated antigen B5-like n=1 Tax=Saccopteryx leptura TaxID=249018 RepID=UPI00339CB144
MPRGNKSKSRVRQKQQQTREEAESRRIFEEAATVVEKQLLSLSFVAEDDLQSSSATESPSTSQASREAAATTFTYSGGFHTTAESKKDEEQPCTSEFLSPDHSGSDLLASQVSVLEQFLLYKYEVKQPILEEDMLKIVSRKYHGVFAGILKKACDHIEVLFAVDLMEVDSISHTYDLVSKLKLPNNGRMRADTGLPKTGLLMTILGIIFLNGNCATEQEVWEFLNVMKVYAGKKHFVFGEPRKLITKDFVRLRYLEYRQIPDSDPPRFEFLWGPKAYAETSKMKVLEYMAKINKKSPSSFLLHYEEALQDEEESTSQRGIQSWH